MLRVGEKILHPPPSTILSIIIQYPPHHFPIFNTTVKAF